MPGITPIFDWPYPRPTDKLADGATVIGNFINALEDQLALTMNKYNKNTSYTSYPLGLSSMMTSGEEMEWPYHSGHVITFKVPNGSHATQLFVWRSAIEERQRVSIRYGYEDDEGDPHWSTFRRFASRGLPTAQASGQVSGTPPSGGGTIALNVTVPGDRFDGPPRVLVSPNATTLPQQVSCSVSNITQNGFTVFLYRTGATTTSIAWLAVYGVDP